jgi:hypothetical protein
MESISLERNWWRMAASLVIGVMVVLALTILVQWQLIATGIVLLLQAYRLLRHPVRLIKTGQDLLVTWPGGREERLSQGSFTFEPKGRGIFREVWLRADRNKYLLSSTFFWSADRDRVVQNLRAWGVRNRFLRAA